MLEMGRALSNGRGTRCAVVVVHQDGIANDSDIPRLDRALSILHAQEAELHAAGVLHAAVFGSVARGDAVAGSDIDVLVELDPAAHVSMIELMSIQFRLGELFGCKVDVISKRGLRPILDDSILNDAISAF